MSLQLKKKASEYLGYNRRFRSGVTSRTVQLSNGEELIGEYVASASRNKTIIITTRGIYLQKDSVDKFIGFETIDRIKMPLVDDPGARSNESELILYLSDGGMEKIQLDEKLELSEGLRYPYYPNAAVLTTFLKSAAISKTAELRRSNRHRTSGSY